MEKKQVGKGIKALIPEENEDAEGIEHIGSKGEPKPDSENESKNVIGQTNRAETNEKSQKEGEVPGRELEDKISEKQKNQRERRLNAIRKMLGMLSSREGEKSKKP